MNTEPTYRPSSEFELFPRAALDHSIAVRFEEIVRRFPDKVASSSCTHTWTYARLNAEANKIAQHIRAAKVSPKTPILLNLQHDAPAIAAVIAVLKTDNFYCALDAALPRERLETIVKTLRPALLICDQTNLPRSNDLAGDSTPLLNIDAAPELPDKGGLTPADPNALAYVFFTSGSTGVPKGVMDCHRNVLHNILRYTNNLHIHREDRLSLLQSLSFSGSVSSLFCALLNGATVCPFDIRQEGATRLADWIIEQKLTIFHAVPSIFRLIATEGYRFPSLRVIRLEGDQASPADAMLFQQHFPRSCVLVNGLGATECGIVRQFFLDHNTPMPANTLPIGYPVEDMKACVIGEDGLIVPSGEIGEIAVKSRYLALGYWDRPDLTEQAFTPDLTDPQSRVYRTGDLGRMATDGCLEYLGRKNIQAKVRGQWVDLADVEASLLRCDGVKEGLAVVRPDRDGEPQIIVYYTVVDDRTIYLDDVRQKLRKELDDHSLPSKLIRLDRLPLNSNGKINRQALPLPGKGRPALRTAYVPPQNLLHQQIALIWENLLQVRPVGIHDDFFDLGGQSLIAARLKSELEMVFRSAIPIQRLLTHSTVAALAALLQDEAAAMIDPIVELRRGSAAAMPFYFLHGDYLSGGLYCVNLARHFDTQQPFYVLPPCGTNGYPIFPSYSEMATLHIEILRSKQPTGPYFLGGTCNGGLVAYEMARQLVAQGEQIIGLILIHATASNLRYHCLRKLVAPLGLVSREAELDCYVRLQPFWHRFSELPLTESVPFFLSKIPVALRRAGAWLGNHRPTTVSRLGQLNSHSIPNYEQSSAIRESYLRIESEYVPEPFGGRVFLLWADGDIESPTDALHWWRQIAPRSELIPIPGTLHTVSLTTYAASVAKIMCSCIARC